MNQLTPSAGLYLVTDSTPTGPGSTLTNTPAVIDGVTNVAFSGYGMLQASAGLDMGSAKGLSRIIFNLMSSGSAAQGWYSTDDVFKIYYGSDNSHWTLLQTITAPTINQDGGILFHVNLDITPTTARYFKVNMPNSIAVTTPGGTNCRGAELSAWGTTAVVIPPSLFTFHG
jgi:hypothetical protein